MAKLTSSYVSEQLWEVYGPYVKDVATRESIPEGWFTVGMLAKIIDENRTKDAASIVESIASFMDERLAQRDWLYWERLVEQVGCADTPEDQDAQEKDWEKLAEKNKNKQRAKVTNG
jgi:hypothetical protein